jgi:hypothetical protein
MPTLKKKKKPVVDLPPINVLLLNSEDEHAAENNSPETELGRGVTLSTLLCQAPFSAFSKRLCQHSTDAYIHALGVSGCPGIGESTTAIISQSVFGGLAVLTLMMEQNVPLQTPNSESAPSTSTADDSEVEDAVHLLPTLPLSVWIYSTILHLHPDLRSHFLRSLVVLSLREEFTRLHAGVHPRGRSEKSAREFDPIPSLLLPHFSTPPLFS